MNTTAQHDRVPDLRGRRDRRARVVFDYRQYAVFSWDWSWRRCVVFAPFGSMIGLWGGIVLGTILENRHIGFAIGLTGAGTISVAMCTGPLAAAWIRSRKWPMEREIVGVIAAVILGVAAAHFCQWLGNSLATRSLRPQVLAPGELAANRLGHVYDLGRSPLSVFINTAMFLLLGGGVALPSYLAEQQRLTEEAREREVGRLQLQKQEADLQLLVLQAQIEPHFLFNTLASLRSLLRQDVDRAEAVIDALVRHLRAAMPVFRQNKQRSTLSEQLRICSSYLELMRVRLPDRLTYNIVVPEGVRDAPFPPLILLTLVENAVKHGIEPKPGQGLIRIDASREGRSDGTYIRVSVTDNGAGLSAGLGHGIGLSNIRAQLALRYGDRASLSLISGAEGGTIASIDIPESAATSAPS